MSFKSISELSVFLSKVEGAEANPSTKVSIAPKEELPPAITNEAELSPQQKAAATRKANKARKDAETAAATTLAAQQPANVNVADNAASIMQQPVAPVAHVAAQPSAINRQAYIDRAVELIGTMKNVGVKDEEVIPHLQSLYAKHGIGWKQISLLEDHELPIVLQELEMFVMSISHPQPQAQSPQSYV